MSRPAGPRKGVGIAELKAHLSECLREVERGHRLTVFDRERPIAVLVPYADSGALSIRRGTGELPDASKPLKGPGFSSRASGAR